MSFARLRPADWVVFVAALALLFTTAPDWYSTTRGEEARQIQEQAPGRQPTGQVRDARWRRMPAPSRSAQERNAWQEDGAARPDHPDLPARHVARSAWSPPSGARAAAGPTGSARSGSRASRRASPRCSCSTGSSRSPGFDEITTVKIGAPLALGRARRDGLRLRERRARAGTPRQPNDPRARHRAHRRVHRRGPTAHGRARHPAREGALDPRDDRDDGALRQHPQLGEPRRGPGDRGLRGLRQARGRRRRGRRLHGAPRSCARSRTGASSASTSRCATASARSAWAPTSAA